MNKAHLNRIERKSVVSFLEHVPFEVSAKFSEQPKANVAIVKRVFRGVLSDTPFLPKLDALQNVHLLALWVTPASDCSIRCMQADYTELVFRVSAGETKLVFMTAESPAEMEKYTQTLCAYNFYGDSIFAGFVSHGEKIYARSESVWVKKILAERIPERRVLNKPFVALDRKRFPKVVRALQNKASALTLDQTFCVGGIPLITGDGVECEFTGQYAQLEHPTNSLYPRDLSVRLVVQSKE